MVSNNAHASDSCSTDPTDYQYGYIDFNSESPPSQWNYTNTTPYANLGFNYLPISANNTVYEGNASGSFKVTDFNYSATRFVTALALNDTAVEFFVNWTCSNAGNSFFQLRNNYTGAARLFCGVDCASSTTKISCGASLTSADIGTGFHRYKVVNTNNRYEFYQDGSLIYSSSIGSNDADKIFLSNDNSDGYGIYDKVMIYNNSLNADSCPSMPINVSNCSISDPLIIINISSFHEDTLVPLTINNFTGVFTFYFSNVSQGINKTYSFQNSNSYGICLSANASTFYDAYITYSVNNGFSERYYIINSSTSPVSQVYLYNFDYTTGLSILSVTNTNNYFTIYPDVVTKMQRFYSAQNVWRTVQVDKTDFNGKAVFYVKQNTNDYRFIFDYLGKQQMVSSSMKFVCDSATSCVQNFVINPTESVSYAGMVTSFTYDNTTGIISYSWNDPSNTVSSIELLVQKIKPDEIITICDTIVNSAAGSINCDISGYEGMITVKAIRDDPELFETHTIEKIVSTLEQALGSSENKKMMIFFAGIIVMGIGLAGLISPVIVILLTITSLIVIVSLGFLSIITVGMVISAACLGIIISFIINQ